jgi:tRNA threonylcarbamoyladenosine biosynthesis protein TsaE
VPVAEVTEAELAAWGATYAARLPWPSWVAISGPLGAGKTTLVRAVARALGVTEPVTSPTYALVHEYRAPRGPVHHLDLYRLDAPTQLAQLGWDDILQSSGIVLVEWPERAAGALPDGHRAITLAHVPARPELRQLSWTA